MDHFRHATRAAGSAPARARRQALVFQTGSIHLSCADFLCVRSSAVIRRPSNPSVLCCRAAAAFIHLPLRKVDSNRSGVRAAPDRSTSIPGRRLRGPSGRALVQLHCPHQRAQNTARAPGLQHVQLRCLYPHGDTKRRPLIQHLPELGAAAGSDHGHSGGIHASVWRCAAASVLTPKQATPLSIRDQRVAASGRCQ